MVIFGYDNAVYLPELQLSDGVPVLCIDAVSTTNVE